MNYIPEVPLGSTRPLYRRADGRYHIDDPCQAPQPLNDFYPYFMCVRNPASLGRLTGFRDALCCDGDEEDKEGWFWWDSTPSWLEFREGMHQSAKGVLKSHWLKRLFKVVESFATDISEAHLAFGSNAAKEVFKHVFDSLPLTWQRLPRGSLTAAAFKQGISEVKRCELVLDAMRR